MKYFDFITDDNLLSELKGSSNQRLSQLEDELGRELPAALKEYLLLMGERICSEAVIAVCYQDLDADGALETMLRGWFGAPKDPLSVNRLDSPARSRQ